MNSADNLTSEMLAAIEGELQRQVARLDHPSTRRFHEMLTYHMGWSGEQAGPEASGKRVRPLMLLLVTAACLGNWQHALPAAAAVELVHNFSLVHDDIQDNSEKRRGRPSLWKKYDVAQAINAGDALFILANRAMLDLAKQVPPELAIRAAGVMHDTCLDLTCGQFLDMSFQSRAEITLEEYWRMIEGKTASLLSGCTHIGCILAAADESTSSQYLAFGRALGLAFQMKDDILGIWGNELLTGKSIASDLLERKKTLPVVYGINRRREFSRRWAQTTIGPGEVPEMARLLQREGAYDFVQGAAQRFTELGMTALKTANPQGEAGYVLIKLTEKLLNRDS